MEPQDDPRFLKGIEEFNQQLFFECHETLEELWLEERGEDRKFYQAIIQIAAGYYKLQQGVPVGALKLWRTGLEKLAPYEPAFYGVNVESLLNAVRGNLAQLEADQGKDPAALSLPSIDLIC
jgi:predicted metal-dependent hydrolase